MKTSFFSWNVLFSAGDSIRADPSFVRHFHPPRRTTCITAACKSSPPENNYPVRCPNCSSWQVKCSTNCSIKIGRKLASCPSFFKISRTRYKSPWRFGLWMLYVGVCISPRLLTHNLVFHIWCCCSLSVYCVKRLPEFIEKIKYTVVRAERIGKNWLMLITYENTSVIPTLSIKNLQWLQSMTSSKISDWRHSSILRNRFW